MKKTLLAMAVIFLSATLKGQTANYGKLTCDRPGNFYFAHVDSDSIVIGSTPAEAITSLWDLYAICRLDGTVTTSYKDQSGTYFVVHIVTISTISGKARLLYAKPFASSGKFTWSILDCEILEIINQLKTWGQQ